MPVVTTHPRSHGEYAKHKKVRQKVRQLLHNIIRQIIPKLTGVTEYKTGVERKDSPVNCAKEDRLW